MSKDPAVLFYYSDFLTGTAFMTDEEVGQYIKLLCHQADKGRLTKKQVLSVCKAHAIPEAIQEKLIIDENGLYYQKRMEEEKLKRSNYVESRRKSALSNKSVRTAYAPRMEDVNLNEDVIKNELVLKEEHILQKFIKKNCPNISKLKKQLTFQEADKLFSEFTHPELQSVIEAMENYKPLAAKSISVNLTIRNWIKRDKQNGTDRKSSTRGSIDFNKWEREIRIARGEMPDVVPASIQR